MKMGWDGLLIVMLIISFSTVNAELTNYSEDCVESDSGLNYYLGGTTSYNNFDYDDTCVTYDAVVNEGMPNEYTLEVGDIQEYACYYPEGAERCKLMACPFVKYHCPSGCENGACLTVSKNVPYCMDNPLKGYSWYDNDGPLKFGVGCLGCSPLCDKVGTSEEGWYSSCDNSLIKIDACGGEEQTCTSTEEKNYYVRGTTTLNGNPTIEICVWEDGKPTNGEEGTRVIESWCESGVKKTEIYVCENGCIEGACVDCSDSDGKDYYARGTNKFDGSSTIEICVGDDGKPTTGEEGTQVTESWCENGEKQLEAYQCPQGCNEGACIKTTPEEKPLDIPKEVIKEEEKISICQGCLLEDKCYPFGYRKDGKYCYDDLKFKEQKGSEESCENNFECGSNLCVDSSCIDEGFFKKILNWFKKLF